jgi:hypothetical protein
LLSVGVRIGFTFSSEFDIIAALPAKPATVALCLNGLNEQDGGN